MGVDLNTPDGLRGPSHIARSKLLTRPKAARRWICRGTRRDCVGRSPLGGSGPGPSDGASREDPGRVVVRLRSSGDRGGNGWLPTLANVALRRDLAMPCTGVGTP